MAQLQFFVFSILILFIVLYFSKEQRDKEYFVSPGVFDQLASTEAFGMSPGTMDQLASTRVASVQEEELDEMLYNNLTRQGIMDMTETGYKGSDYGSAMYE
jgi:hypothetical protein